MRMKANEIDFITMGCSKNLVDSEKVMHRLEQLGYVCTHDAEQPKGAIAIVNTCGFIGDAKEESVNMILELAQRKQEGKLKRLYVMGCLSQRYKKELQEEIPEDEQDKQKIDRKIDDIDGERCEAHMQRRREILDACAQQHQIKRQIAPSGDGLGARETAAKRVIGFCHGRRSFLKLKAAA